MSISIHALLTESDRFRRGQLDHHRHFNPRSPHGERLHYSNRVEQLRRISIHALLTESDYNQYAVIDRIEEFQSTLSSRRATWIR